MNTRYSHQVIRSIRHKGLRTLDETDNAKGVPAEFAGKLRRILTVLSGAGLPETANLPSFGLHQLTGNRRGTWAIVVTRNWRVTFKVEGGDAVDVDYEDYH